MRIALVIPSVNWTQGVPHAVAALARALSNEHEVHLVAGAYDIPDLNGVVLHKIPTLPLGITAFHATFVVNMYLRRALGSIAPGHDFDIVHGAGYTCPFANVVTAHFCQAREQRLLGNGTPGRTSKSWRQGIRDWDYRFYSGLSSIMEHRYYSTSPPKVVIAISQSVKDDLIQEFGIPREKVVIIPNGVDTKRFHPANRLLYRQLLRRHLGLDESDTVALFIGNSWERKGLGPAIEAVRAIANPKLKLVVVGAGDPSAYCSSQELSNTHHRVVFVNGLEPQIERYYAAADFLLFPTTYEPFGLVALEAMASGLPVIVSATAGVAEHMTDGETGLLLYNPTDLGELRDKIELLLSDADLRMGLATRGRLLAEKFTWDSVAALTLDAYHLALGNGGVVQRERQPVKSA